jgi:putative flippase GtrA
MLKHSFIRFLIVGIFNTLLGYSTMLILFHFLNLSYTWSYFLSYMFGMIVSYFLNRHYVFRSKNKPIKEFILFFMVFIVSYLISYFVLYITIEYKILSTNYAFFVSMSIYSLLFYILNKRVTFL